MTGAEHYAEAERLLRNAEGVITGASASEIEAALDVGRASIAAAQAHATLALAAATAHDTATGYALIGEYGDHGEPRP